MKRVNSPFLVSSILIVFLWVLSKNLGWINDLFLPTPKQLLTAFVSLFSEHDFLDDIIASVLRVFSAFFFSAIIAIPLALLMFNNKTLRQILAPYIDFIRYLPVPALIPLTILFFGIGETAKIVLLFIGTFFQLILLIIDDLDEIPKEHFYLTYSLKLNGFQEMWYMFRKTLPQIYDNSRITIGWCWTYVIIAELVASSSGIGHMIKEAQRFSNTPNMYAGIITMGIIGFGTDFLFKKFYPSFFRYKMKAKM
ncbi:ABC transporter permease [Flagellimonas myxillae]|uniref:ABC transporter permease n=1 Tax=Flagellimonas myxillae TaxID=2942214 RepID=UPI00201EED77|nr:ABC transporter permease [Muricauda myxillae]MCL6268154.1 ABC transporter permease [Muricauda myxillae]